MKKCIRLLLSPLLIAGLILGSAAPSEAILIFYQWRRTRRPVPKYVVVAAGVTVGRPIWDTLFVAHAPFDYFKLAFFEIAALGIDPELRGEFKPLTLEEADQLGISKVDATSFNQELPRLNLAYELLLSELEMAEKSGGRLDFDQAHSRWIEIALDEVGLSKSALMLLQAVAIKRASAAHLYEVTAK